MRKNKLLLLLALLMTAATGAWADNTVRWEKFQISELNLMQGDRETIDDVKITCNGGSASNNGGDICFNGEFTFSVPAGSVLTQIVIVDETWLSVTGWSVDESLTQATWTGSARSVACEITTSNAQYIEFTIASAVPKMYTSEVSITDLVPGDTLAEGATIIGSGSDEDMVFLAFGRTKKNGVVPSFWTNLGLPPTVIGTNGTISGTYTPVDGNGQDGNAWVVTDAQLNDYDGFEVGLGGIILPEQPQLYTVTFADGGKDTQNWTITPAEATTTGVAEGQTVTLQYNGRLKVKGVKATSDAAPAVKPAATLTEAPKPWDEYYVGDELLETLGTAEGGTLMYKLTTTNVKPTSTEGFSTENPKGVENAPSYKNYIWYYIKGDDTHSDSEIFGPIELDVWDS